jgi:putative membrane protein
MTVVNPASSSLLDGGYCCGAMGGWGWLGMVAVSLIMLGLIVWVAWAVQRPSSHSTPKPTALEILAARYASGEISEEEYDQRRSVLREEANQ